MIHPPPSACRLLYHVIQYAAVPASRDGVEIVLLPLLQRYVRPRFGRTFPTSQDSWYSTFLLESGSGVQVNPVQTGSNSIFVHHWQLALPILAPRKSCDAE